MKDSAVSENKQDGGSVLKIEEISRQVKSDQDDRINPLAGIIARSGCNGRGCSRSLSLLARGIAEAPGAQRKTIGNSLQKSLGNRFVQGLAVQRLQSAKEMTASGRNGILQAKLVIGPADDEYEREADRIAEQAVRMPETPVQRACPFFQEDEPVQREPLSARIMPLIQRQETEEEDENKLQASPMIQRQIGEKEEEEKIQTAPEVAGSKGGPAGPGLEQSLEQARGSGRPLAESFRGRMESAFGADFSSVRIHADEPADRLSRSIQARAFTRGHDIFLRQGEYQPASAEGQRLLAHELTHVVQQGQKRATYAGQMRRLTADSDLIQRVSCDVTGKFIDIPRGPLKAAFLTHPIGKLGNSFRMEAEFEPTSSKDSSGKDCDCRAGIYRQYVKGEFKRNDIPQQHKLTNGNFLDPSNYNIDGLGDLSYGDRMSTQGFNRYSPDHNTGCKYKGIDTPGIGGSQKKDKLSVNLDFKGELLNTHNSKNDVIASSCWSVIGEETFP